jgi:transposase
MSNASGVSRGDRNRNARLARLRELVRVSTIVGIGLADKTQTVVVTDHDSRVLARRTFRFRAWGLGAALDWAAGKAAHAGHAGVTVACEPTWHRWRVLGQLAADRGMAFVCMQPLMSSRARRGEDLTFDKTDDKDAVLIARITAQLRCHVPEPVDETRGRLRHLGVRRARLVTEMTAQVQQAALSVVLDQDGGDLARTRRLGLARFEAQVRKEAVRWGASKPCPMKGYL